MAIDATAALVIVGALALSMAVALGRHHRAAQKLADTRAALQVAEAVLTDLQAGKESPQRAFEADPEVKVELRPAADGARAPDGAADARWTEVVVTVRAARASLVGPVPGRGTP